MTDIDHQKCNELGALRQSKETKQYSMPKWFKDASKKENLAKNNFGYWTYLDWPCQDHTKYLKHNEDKDICVIFEPYFASIEDLEPLINICKRNNIDLTISGYASHYPGHVLRIILRKKENVIHTTPLNTGEPDKKK
ncbi:MAG: hypothetical protein OIN86_00670 [Candidatus Methanoperedens sp.]|nr:hypothetical protein [Candidatus Methanoperedens sp.]CAG0965336.1 hypothetical protein METP1_00941 [Methanosarcinales archaeon]